MLNLIKTVFLEQEKFPLAEEKLKALKGTEEFGFQAVVMFLLSCVRKLISWFTLPLNWIPMNMCNYLCFSALSSSAALC